MPSKTTLIATVALCAFFGAMGQLFFKLGSGHLTADPLTWISNWRIFVGILMYGATTVLFLWALKYGSLSLLYPVIATSYIWVVLFSIVLLGESFPAFKWFGVGAILGGVLIIAL